MVIWSPLFLYIAIAFNLVSSSLLKICCGLVFVSIKQYIELNNLKMKGSISFLSYLVPESLQI